MLPRPLTTLLALATTLTLPLWAEAPLVHVTPDKVIPPSQDTPHNTGPDSPNRVLPNEPPTRKSYLVPALEIPVFITLLNRIDVGIYGREDYGVSWESTKNHILHGPWVVDHDNFAVNQIGHPYQGSVYYGLARSANLNYWESFLYANAGSVIWELAGETTNPSINDQVASGTAGSFLGEALYRLSNLVLEEGGPEPSGWRKAAAAAISPPTELNRLIFGDAYGPVFQNRNPAIDSRLQLGAASNATRNAERSNVDLARTAGYADFHLAYGLPGKPGYRYQRPFDYFDVQVNTIVEKGHQYNSGAIRGLLYGQRYEDGERTRGVWGLYGTYDYLSPQVYRLSTTGAAVGTTAQWWATRRIAVQGTMLAGLGYGSAGTILPDNNESDFHYGMTPQQLLAFRVIFGNRAMLDTSARNYFITRIGSSKAPGTEKTQQVESSFAIRLWGRHAIAVGYLLAHRDANYVALPGRQQLVQTVTLTYNFLAHAHFGAVEWRDGETTGD